ncbi:2-dehydro-3-deoxygluconokinase [Spirochaetota bacterium]|nr:2-dehydro-3-deoxygluconokinase [Spirochaetota bacterium]
MQDTLSLGESMVLFTAPRGESIECASYFTKSLGGAESNFAIGLARLGFKSSWYSLLGNDPLGRFILNAVRKEAVNISHVKLISTRRTGVYYKSIASDGNVAIVYDRKHSAFSHMTPADLDNHFIADHRILHLTGITACLSRTCYETVLQTLTYFMGKATASDLTTQKRHILFDLNIRNKLWDTETSQQRLLALAKRCTLVLGSIDEYQKIATPHLFNNIRAIATWVLDELKIPAGIVKLGSAGAIYFDRKEEFIVPAFKIATPIDPIGAGDAFAAGIAAGLLQNKTMYETLRQANAMGAIVLSGAGDIEPLPTPKKLATFIQTHRERTQTLKSPNESTAFFTSLASKLDSDR